MTRDVITVGPETTIVEAANVMLANRISGLPVLGSGGELLGVVSEGDFLRRAEIDTLQKRSRWMSMLLGSGTSAEEFVRLRGRKVGEVMTREPVTVIEQTSLLAIVDLMEKNNIKRVPVMRSSQLVGIVSRSNLLQAVAKFARTVPGTTVDDHQIHARIVAAMDQQDWMPLGLHVVVRNGSVSLSGAVTSESSRAAAVVAAESVDGVTDVSDHLCWIEPMSGVWLGPAEMPAGSYFGDVDRHVSQS